MARYLQSTAQLNTTKVFQAVLYCSTGHLSYLALTETVFSKQEFRDEILGAETGLGVLIYSYQSERRFRTEVRTATRINATTLRPLQSLSGQDNLCLINALMDSTKSETRRQKLLGVRAVLEEVLAPVFTKYSTAKHDQSLPSGVILFDRSFELFSSYGNSILKARVL